MNDYITIAIEATMDALKKHGLIKVGTFFMVLMAFATILILAWKMPEVIPEIILAIKA